MKRKLGTTLVLLSLAIAGSLSPAFAQQTCTLQTVAQFQFIYSVKFVCGLQTFASSLNASAVFQPPKEPPLKPGNYATSVNIHNYLPTDQSAQFCKKAVVALTEHDTQTKPGPISPLVAETLVPNGAMAVTCSDIVGLFPPVIATLPPLFIEGFVEIFSPLPLSVTAVYTSQTCRNPSPGKRCAGLGELATEVVPQSALPLAPK